jgi:hypothetical protein
MYVILNQCIIYPRRALLDKILSYPENSFIERAQIRITTVLTRSRNDFLSESRIGWNQNNP